MRENAGSDIVMIFLKTCFLLCLFILYGACSAAAMTAYGILFGIPSWGFQELSLHEILIASLGFYFWIFLSLFNIIALPGVIIRSKKLLKNSFRIFLVRNLKGIFVSYLIYALIILVFLKNDTKGAFTLHLPQRLGKPGGEVFWGNIIGGTLLFYSWFLPLWYYRLGGWFWTRGKYAKMD